jgi:hypothetical protein
MIMMTTGFLAGAFRVNEENSLRALFSYGPGFTQALIYFGALFLVGLGFFAWAIIFRRHRHRRHLHHPPKLASKHRQPLEDRPHNRTLAAAGGLPPVRAENQPPSPA